jgi:hypothetical protein
LAAYETEACERFDHVVWVTEEDRQAVTTVSGSAKNGQSPSTVIPICVDSSQSKLIAPAAERRRVTFLGGCIGRPMQKGLFGLPGTSFPVCVPKCQTQS